MGRRDGQLGEEEMKTDPPDFPLTSRSCLSSDVWERVELPITSRLKKSQWVQWLIFPPVGI